MNKIKNFIISITVTIVGFTGLATPVYAAVNAVNSACNGLTYLDPTKSCSSGGQSTITNTIANVTKLISIVVGAVAVIVIIFAGFKFITGGSDPKAIETAKNMLLYAGIGLIISALAGTIAFWVLRTSSTITQ